MAEAKIWDPVVRIFHWTVAAAFLANHFVLEEGGDIHELAGYYILIAVGVRIIWGFVGTKNARFSDFFPTPSGIKEHISAMRSGQMPEENGHNPVGALMVFALLIGMIVAGGTGWMSEMDAFMWEDWVLEVHEVAANLTLLLVFVHVAAVLFFSFKGPRNLIRQMVTGRIERH